MNSYTASNGVGLTITRDRVVRWRPGIPPDLVSSALREYFQAERDEALDRWRDPENPDMVCYPVECDPNAVWVVYEGDGRRYHATRTGWELTRPHYASEAAGRYFQAHPDPNPWRTAQPDEIWVLTDGDRSEVFRCGENGLYSLKTGDPISRVFPIITVTAGHRIWPEEDQ